MSLGSGILSTLCSVHFSAYAPMRRGYVPRVLRNRSMLNITRAKANGATTCLLPMLDGLSSNNCPGSTVGYIVVSPAHRLTRRVSRTVRNFNCCLRSIDDITICNNGSNGHCSRRLGDLHVNTSIIVTAPNHLVARVSLNGMSLDGMDFFVLSRTSHVLSVNFSRSVGAVTSGLPGAYRAVVFSTAVPRGVRRLTGTLLGSPMRVGLTMDGPTRGVGRRTCIYCRARGVAVVGSVFGTNSVGHIVIFDNDGVGIGRLTTTLRRVNVGYNTVRSSLRRTRHSSIVFGFGDNRFSMLITASVITHKVSVSSVRVIVGCSIPRSARSCIRHVNHATHTGHSNETVAFIGRRSRC